MKRSQRVLRIYQSLNRLHITNMWFIELLHVQHRLKMADARIKSRNVSLCGFPSFSYKITGIQFILGQIWLMVQYGPVTEGQIRKSN